MKPKDKDYIKIFMALFDVKDKVQPYGLIAEYVPFSGYIEILDANRDVVAISFNGKTIKEPNTKQYYNLDKWITLFGTSIGFLASLGFTDKITSSKQASQFIANKYN